MRTHFRYIGLGLIFLAVIVAATSCKKPKEPAPEKAAEPWVVAAVLEWGLWADDNGPSLVLYSDRRLIIKRPPPKETSSAGLAYWTRVLSSEEFDKIDEAASLALRTSCRTDGYDTFTYGRTIYFGAVTNLYFGIPGKGVAVNIERLPLLKLLKDIPDEFSKRIEDGFVPPALNQYCALLPSLVRGDFEPWKPIALTIEFYAEPTEKARGAHWPDDWPKPQFSTPATNSKRAYVKLDANKLGLVQKLLGGNPPGEASVVEIDGKQYAAEYRFYFPGEENWRHSFPRFVVDEMFDEPPVSKTGYSSPAKPKDAFER